MSEKIPADIMKAADDVVACVNVDCSDRDEQVLHVARAIVAERKRCAEAYMHWARKMMEEVEGKSE